VLGLYRRGELVNAIIRTLESIRAGIPSDTTKARFDRIFRPDGSWTVDLHDAALVWARTQRADISWKSAEKALRQSGWVARGDTAGDPETVPRALYALRVLAANDSIGFAAALADLRSAEPTSADAVRLLLQGYAEAQRWYAEAIGFFLTEPWAVRAGRAYSIGDLVREDGQRVRPSPADSLELTPEIRTRLFGYPQALPRYGVPPRLFERLLGAGNETAREWLRQHGSPALLRTLHRLPSGDTTLTLLQVGMETVRVSSVPRQAMENLNGFLEPGDLIAIDPGYSPLLALGAVVHEWQHLFFRRLQLDEFVARHPQRGVSIVRLPGVHPYLAEGLAEWSAERILEPLVARWPLLGLGELEKRAGLARENAEDQHALGYALVRELAGVLGDPAITTRVLLRYAEDPGGIDAEPALRKAWWSYRSDRDYVFAAPARRVLVPEVTFTIEDGYPDVVSTRILVPAGTPPSRATRRTGHESRTDRIP
jgi:hypothetical protein